MQKTGAQVDVMMTHVLYTQHNTLQHIHTVVWKAKCGEDRTADKCNDDVYILHTVQYITMQHIHTPVWKVKGGGDWNAGRCNECTHVLYTQYNIAHKHVWKTKGREDWNTGRCNDNTCTLHNTYTHLYGRQKVGETGTQVGVMATRVLREESYHGGAQGGSVKDGQQNGHV